MPRGAPRTGGSSAPLAGDRGAGESTAPPVRRAAAAARRGTPPGSSSRSRRDYQVRPSSYQLATRAAGRRPQQPGDIKPTKRGLTYSAGRDTLKLRTGCCSSPRHWFSGDAEKRNKSIPGAATPVGWYFQYQELLCVTTTALFFAAAPPPDRPGPVVHIPGAVATVAPPGRSWTRNGEVWSSPCRESTRRRPRSQQGRCRQGIDRIPPGSPWLK